MTIKAGDTLPDVTFMTMTADGPQPMSTDDVFGGKRVALFAVPGRLHPDLFGQAPAGLHREGRRAAGQGRGPDRLHLGQ